MSSQIYVNLPVKNLSQSLVFFKSLGFAFNAKYSDETAACMVVSDSIFVMLLTHDKFKTFSPNPICDAKQSTEVLLCLSQSSRSAVDELVVKAVAGGGNTYKAPQDHGFMYFHGFQDLDGHIWELMYMDANAATGQG